MVTPAERAHAIVKQWRQEQSLPTAWYPELESNIVIAIAEAVASERERLLNTPEIHDFAAAVGLEAAHQQQRWGIEHDNAKDDADWFWLIGYLAGKALWNPDGDTEKRLHRVITIAAAAQNWHAAIKARSAAIREATP